MVCVTKFEAYQIGLKNGLNNYIDGEIKRYRATDKTCVFSVEGLTENFPDLKVHDIKTYRDSSGEFRYSIIGNLKLRVDIIVTPDWNKVNIDDHINKFVNTSELFCSTQ